MSRRAALLLALTVALAASAARAGEPAAEPPEVAALEWREACTLEHTRVAPHDRISTGRGDWVTPSATDAPLAATDTAIVALGRMYETGAHGTRRPKEAARLYCLALRRDGSLWAAAYLSGLHARGAGVVRSSVLADHFARVAAIRLKAMDFRAGRQGPEPPWPRADPRVAEKVAAARRWLDRQQRRPAAELEALSLALMRGIDRPRSERLGEWLYLHAALDASHARATAGIAVRYARHQVRVRKARLRREPWHAYLVFTALYNAAGFERHPLGQRLFGRLLLTGEVLGEDRFRGLLWSRLAEQGGVEVDFDLDAMEATLPPSERELLRCRVKLDDVPNFPLDPPKMSLPDWLLDHCRG